MRFRRSAPREHTHTSFPLRISEHATQYLVHFGAMPVPRALHTLHGAQCFSRAPGRLAISSMTCFSHSGVLKVLGALNVFRGVPGTAEHFEVPDASEHFI